jgi:uncharacterized protein (TIGR03437 family)
MRCFSVPVTFLVALLIPATFLLTADVAIAGQFTTVIGGAYPVAVAAIATDPAGNTYVVGSAQIADTPSFVNSSISALAHVFVTKLDPNGKVLFTDTFAGQGADTGAAIAVDPTGNIYIAGTTSSPDFPINHALQTQIYPGAAVNSGGVPTGSGFITKLSNDGSTVLYSTFFGGTLGQSAITSLATDTNGNLYLTGYTQASDFPHTTGMPFGAITQSPALAGTILASISAAGDKILYSGAIPMPVACTMEIPNCISGPAGEGVGIAVDAAGNAYVAGNDGSYANLPTTPGVLTPNGIGGFVAKVNAGGTGLGYLTYIGSFQLEGPPFGVDEVESNVYAIAVDAAGNAYLTGTTGDPNFPATPGSYQPVAQPPNGIHGFVAKLNPSGSAMVWATYFGEPGVEPPRLSIAIDAGGDLWITGTAAASTFPNANAWTTGPEYLAELNAAGSKLIYSALYPSGTIAQSVAVDPSGIVHTAGSAGFISAIAPTAAPAVKIFALQNASLQAAGTARVSPGEVIAIYGPGIGPAAAASATPSKGFYPTTLGGVTVSVNGVNIPLLYVSANQINVVVPMALASNAAVTFQVTNGTAVSPAYPAWIVASSAGAFTPVFNQDGTLNSQSNPAPGGSIVTFYATGWQSNFAPFADGQVATAMQDTCLGTCTASASTGTVGIPFGGGGPFATLPATALYGGAAPGIVAGVTQFNVQLGTVTKPPSTATAAYSVSAGTAGNFASAGVWITP